MTAETIVTILGSSVVGYFTGALIRRLFVWRSRRIARAVRARQDARR